MSVRLLVIALLFATGCKNCSSEDARPTPSAASTVDAAPVAPLADGDAGIRRMKVMGGIRGPTKTIPTTLVPKDAPPPQ